MDIKGCIEHMAPRQQPLLKAVLTRLKALPSLGT